MRHASALALAVALAAMLSVGSAQADETIMEKEFVGNVENQNKLGSGLGEDPFDFATPQAARAAGSANSIAEGPPPGRSEAEVLGDCDPSEQNPDDNDCYPDYPGDPVVRQGPYNPNECQQFGEGGTFDIFRLPTDTSRPLELTGDDCRSGSRPDVYAVGRLLQENFRADPPQQVLGAESVNGYDVYQNVQSCFASEGGPTDFYWTFGIERVVRSDIQIQICLDVRKCNENQDALGQSMTIDEVARIHADGDWEAPVIIKVVHHRGNFNPVGQTRGPSECPCEDRTLVDIANPTLAQIEHPQFPEDFIPDLPRGADPGDFNEIEPFGVGNDNGHGRIRGSILDESVAFIGRDCIVKTVKNDGRIAPHDFLTVQLKVPSSTRHRVRASQDSAALCYLGAALPGEE